MPCTLQARTAKTYIPLSFDSAVISCTVGSGSRTAPAPPVSETTPIPLTNCKPSTSQGAINPPTTQCALISPVLPLSKTAGNTKIPEKNTPLVTLSASNSNNHSHPAGLKNATDPEKNISDVAFIDFFKSHTQQEWRMPGVEKKYPTF